MKTTKSHKQETISDIREKIIKFEGFAAAQPQNEIYRQTLDGLRRRYTDRMDQGEREFMEKHGGADWWESAKLMYPIKIEEDGTLTVISEARDWIGERAFGPYSHKFEALEKIEKLVFYKNNDRNRGIGDRDADIERVAPMAFIQTGRVPQGRKVPQRQKIMVQGITQKAVKTIKEKLIVALPEATPAVTQLRA